MRYAPVDIYSVGHWVCVRARLKPFRNIDFLFISIPGILNLSPTIPWNPNAMQVVPKK